MRRILFVLTATLLLAGCESITEPTPRLRPATVNRDEIPEGAVPDPLCRSGWSVANGRCL